MIRYTAIALASVLVLSGCAGPHSHPYAYGGGYRNTLTGAAIGAAGGALVGHAVDDGGRGALVGGAVGAMVGGGVGYHMDKKAERDRYDGRPYYPENDYRDHRGHGSETYPYRH